MRFEINHLTTYEYGQPAAEAYLELRLTPPELPTQRILRHSIGTDPEAPRSSYTDHHGNRVDFLSLPFRHTRLRIRNRLTVQTLRVEPPATNLEIPIAEALQILRSQMPDLFAYLQFTDTVQPHREATTWAKKFLAGDQPIGEALDALTTAIYREFEYSSGSTDISTPLSQVWKNRKGVCQDFAHVMLGVLRSARIPSRYVCGYVDSSPENPTPGSRPGLKGSLATHAWVEVFIPGGVWFALDPTNNRRCGQQHVSMAVGKDFRGAAPVRGTFKGSGGQRLRVAVSMRRLKDEPPNGSRAAGPIASVAATTGAGNGEPALSSK